jgi:uncharacterized peroxidase-related enzyme
VTKFPVHTIASAPSDSKEHLEAAEKGFGFIPNLSATMAESPELLAAYSTLWDLFGKSTLSPVEQQIVYMTSSFENRCNYCMAGHTALSKMLEIDPSVINALRSGNPIADRKLEALHRYATGVVRNRGWVSDADTDEFLAAGYTRRNVLEVILGTATKVISNYTNHIAHTATDAFMKGNEWKEPVPPFETTG